MNKKTILLLLIAFCISCKKEPVQAPSVTLTQKLSIAEAKTWYENNPELKDKYPINWEQAEPMQNEKAIYGWMLPTPGIPEFQGLKLGYRKLAFYKDPVTAQPEIRIIEYIPDALTLQRNADDPNAKFTGQVMLFNIDRQLKEGYILHEGNKVGLISPDTSLATKEMRNYSTSQKPGSSNGKTSTFIIIATSHWETYSFVDGSGVFTVYSFKVTNYSTSGGYGGGSIYNPGNKYTYEPPHGKGVGAPAAKLPVPKPSNLPGANGPKVDPKKLMDCFTSISNTGATMKITVLVQEAFPGTSFNMGPNSFGHTALAITKTNGNQSITQIVGFYPTGTGAAKFNCPSKILDNGGLEYNLSATYTVDAAKFAKITAYVSNPPPTYDAADYNCTNFVFDAMKAGGINLPDPTVTVGLVGPGGAAMAMTPTGLAMAYRDMKAANPKSNISTTTNTAPQSKGECK